jgi:DeoR/GlpR family transcriptional regulator of sugar metabolism
MLTAERRRLILETLRSDGKVLATDMSHRLGVSPDTIRRDLGELAEQGLLTRVHGGALPLAQIPPGFAARRRRHRAAKAGIGRAAVGLARDGQLILIDGGTTALEVARALPEALRATVLTHSPPVAVVLAEHPAVEVVLVGGELSKHAVVTVGAAAVEALRAVRADLCFLGVCAVHPEIGVTTMELEERHVKRAMVDVSAEVVALAEAEKIGTAGPYVVSPIDELTHIATETGVPEEVLVPYRTLGIEILRG